MVVKQFQNFWDFDPSSAGHTCVALTRRKRKCQRPVRQHQKLDLEALQGEIAKGVDGKSIYELLSLHAAHSLCAQHRSYVSSIDDPVFQWAHEIDQAATEDSNFCPPFNQSNPKERFSVYDAAQRAHQYGLTTTLRRKTLDKWPCGGDLLITDLLSSSLVPRDAKSGILYAYTKPSDSSLVKIGTTSRSLNKRFNEIRYTCGYEPNLILESGVIPYARRAEQLIFLELQESRRQENDCSCCIEHAEWFEVEVEAAKQTIQSWAEWLERARPYDEDGHIKQHVAHTIQDMTKDQKVTGKLLVQTLNDTNVTTES